MQLTIFNGSPRGTASNTELLLSHYIKGFLTTPGNSVETRYLIDEPDMLPLVERFSSSGNVIIAFPLYCDAMPAIVKTFIEALAPLEGRDGNPRLGFFVQCGLPEARHCRYVEVYLEKLAGRIGSEYLGTMIRTGVEGIQLKPDSTTKPIFESFRLMGGYFGEAGVFNETMVRSVAGSDIYSSLTRVYLKALVRTGSINFYWDMILKHNKAYDRRNDRPYQPS